LTQRISDGGDWFLEGLLENDSIARRYTIKSGPFRVGRQRGLDLSLPLSTVSALHAEIGVRNGVLWVRDLDSRNGTFVNRQRISGGVTLNEGDIVQFAESAFVVGRTVAEGVDELRTVVTAVKTLPPLAAGGTRALDELLANREVVALLQPVVCLPDRTTFGYEILGRGSSKGLPSAPEELFRIASSVGCEVELSKVFLSAGIEAATALSGEPAIFINAHPRELMGDELLHSLQDLRASAPTVKPVVEIHEGTVTSPQLMRELRARLTSIEVGLAYDDFGAGQARLLELVEVPPDFLKFDTSLVGNMPDAPASNLRLVETLVGMVRDMGIACIAEGVETEAGLACCQDMGFQYIQGYAVGRPAPVGEWLNDPPADVSGRR